MCWCNRNLRTTCCGGDNCHPPAIKGKNEILQNSQLQLWQSYCEKKQECEDLRGKLKETLDMLEYSHVTSEVYYNHEKVSEFIGNMYKFLEEK